jgi:hypothetical protein
VEAGAAHVRDKSLVFLQAAAVSDTSRDPTWADPERAPAWESTAVMDRPEGLRAGAIVGGRYRLGATLGEGGMGIVFEATDLRTGELRAVKCLRRARLDDSVGARFEREARLLASIRHPAVVRLLDAGVLPGGGIFFVMERLVGETLHDLLRRTGALAPHAFFPLLDGIADALEALHARGLIHRDLKPSNIFVTVDPVVPVRLIDFGIAKVLSDPRLTKTGELVGTPGFMAPEQLLSDRGIDPRADVFALGALSYLALTGRAPFGNGIDALRATVEGKFLPVRMVNPSLGPSIASAIESALAPEPEQRPPTARALADAIREAIERSSGVRLAPRAQVPESAPVPQENTVALAWLASSEVKRSEPPAAFPPIARPRRRWVAPLAMIAAALTLAGAGFGAVVAMSRLSGESIVAVALADGHDDAPAITRADGPPIAAIADPAVEHAASTEDVETDERETAPAGTTPETEAETRAEPATSAPARPSAREARLERIRARRAARRRAASRMVQVARMEATSMDATRHSELLAPWD